MKQLLYPVGLQSFESIRRDGYVYVDKTALIHHMVTTGKFYFLSRPRRFGKSLLISTLQAYFQGRRELFEGLAMDRLEQDWAPHPVLRLDFANKNFARPQELTDAIEGFLCREEDKYGHDSRLATFGDRFMNLIVRAEQQTGRRVVVLIDEYDKPLLDVMDTPQEAFNRDVLRGFYGTLKSADQHLRFVLLTGITKFAQISIFSGLNNLCDISMDCRYDTLCGITTEELYTIFAQPIREMAHVQKRSEEEIKAELRQHYDGYHFSSAMRDVYNPFSILCAMDSGRLNDYWFSTASPTYLVRLMENFHQDIRQITQPYYPQSEFVDYRAAVQRPLPMLYQSGYLTIKDYRPATNTYRLDFPNDEVRRGFTTMLADNYLKPKVTMGAWMSDLVEALLAGDTALLRNLMTSFLAGIPYRIRAKRSERAREQHFQYTLYLILRMLTSFTVVAEKEQSQGRVDCIVETPQHVYIFEFKRDGTAADALNQIHDRGYAREFAADRRQIHLIGCNFSSKTGTIDDWAEE